MTHSLTRSPAMRQRYGRAGMGALAVTGAVALFGLALAQHPEPLRAQDDPPVFTKDVAPILYRNCATCHRPGGLGPFSVLDYDSAKANAADIADAVKTGTMPPWHADGPHGTFRNDRRLTEEEKQIITKWVASGSKRGDLKYLPPKPVFPTSWEIGVPDGIAAMPEDFHVPASGTIEYQYFEVPTDFGEDKWVTAIEFKPGAREVVHHVIVFARVPAAAATAPATPPAPRPAGTPAPQPVLIRNPAHAVRDEAPRLDTLHPPPKDRGVMIGGTAPGTNVMEMPAGTALRLRRGTVITFQMHYTARGHEAHDRTQVGFRFTKEAPEEEVRMNSFQNGAFVIPPGAKDVAVPAEIKFGEAVRVWSLLPHTHLRGTKWKYTLEKPDGTSEVILDVPRYDFNWQTNYFFTKPLEIPAGGKIVSTAWYDNSTGNASNPDPTKEVRWGDQTWEEMQFTGFLYSINSRRLKPPSQ
jgi:mono/diheme cytochrome c family protein